MTMTCKNSNRKNICKLETPFYYALKVIFIKLQLFPPHFSFALKNLKPLNYQLLIAIKHDQNLNNSHNEHPNK